MINREKLVVGDYLQSDDGKFAFVDKILKDRIRVWIGQERHYLSDENLEFWSYGNPIKNNRIVSSQTFAIRFKQFLNWLPKNWVWSQPHYEEEFEYMSSVADHLLKYQIQTAKSKEEIEYLKRLNLL